jgi:hypothetical protein
MADIAHRTADVNGLTVFYRETGEPDAATLVLLPAFRPRVTCSAS